MKILVVEDEINLNRLLTQKLKKEHYSVDSCFDGNDALIYIKGTDYDVIVLDIMIPGIDGLEVLRTIRSQNIKTPVLLLTAKDSIEDRVIGLNAGADDYLIKPFAFDELIARIKVMIRRNSNHTSEIFEIDDLKVNCETREVTRANTSINLSAKEFDILEYMIRRKGKVLSRDNINEHVWNYNYEGGSNIVDVYIRYLRKKIDDNFDKKLIHTIRGAGYVLREND